MEGHVKEKEKEASGNSRGMEEQLGKQLSRQVKEEKGIIKGRWVAYCGDRKAGRRWHLVGETSFIWIIGAQLVGSSRLVCPAYP